MTPRRRPPVAVRTEEPQVHRQMIAPIPIDMIDVEDHTIAELLPIPSALFGRHHGADVAVSLRQIAADHLRSPDVF